MSASEHPVFTSNRQAVLAGVELVYALFPLRERRQRGDDPAAVAAERDAWVARRAAWWDAMVAAEARGVWMPLLTLAERLALVPAEIDVLLVALGAEVDPEMREHFARARESWPSRALDVELVVGLLFHSKEERLTGRALLSPEGRLVRQGLVALAAAGSGGAPHETGVQPSEALANFVLERPLLSGRAGLYGELVEPAHTWDQMVLPEAQKRLVWQVVAAQEELGRELGAWGYDDVMTRGRGSVLLFSGPPGTGKTGFAHAIAHRLGRRLLVVRASRLLAATEPLQPILADIFRIASFAGALVLLDDCERLIEERDARFLAFLEALDEHDGLLVLTTNQATRIDYAMERRILLRLELDPPSTVLREQIWEVHLPANAPLGRDIDVPLLAGMYEFTGAQIRSTVLVALARMMADGLSTLTMAHLREAAETQLGARFDGLAVRDGGVPLDARRLVLPEREARLFRDVLAACRHHDDVMTRWGFGRHLTTGRGICVLFDGPPGTGKTLAADILAAELRRPLFRVYIPRIVSKWVGETERNLAEIFVRARASRGILLFDEADALFGRRTADTRGATDRYANMEVNLLLQEIERYDGITVLTTNLYGNLDEALQRRVQFRLTFPMPDPAERARIWEALLPPEAPLGDDVDYATLGRHFELSGGHIKNAILRAAYRARDEGPLIRQQHLVDGAVSECLSQGKLVREPTATPARPPQPAPEPPRESAPRGYVTLPGGGVQ